MKKRELLIDFVNFLKKEHKIETSLWENELADRFLSSLPSEGEGEATWHCTECGWSGDELTTWMDGRNDTCPKCGEYKFLVENV